MKYLYYLFAISAFMVLVLALEGLFLAWESRRHSPARPRRTGALSDVAVPGSLPPPAFSDLPALDRLLARLPRACRLERLLRRSGTEMTVAMFLALSVLLGLLGFLLPAACGLPPALAGPFAAVFLVVPALGACLAAWRRRCRFERQWPAALDRVAQALAAGRPFADALEGAAAREEEPLAGEFRRVCAELAQGTSLRESLCRLAERVPSADLSYFVAAVLAPAEDEAVPAAPVAAVAALLRRRRQLLAAEQGRGAR